MVTQPRPGLPVPPALNVMIESWGLYLAASLSPKTQAIYLDAVRRLASWLATERPGTDWGAVTREDMARYMAAFRSAYSPGYANNQWRALLRWWAWWSGEEQAPNPAAGLKGPKPGDKVVPVLGPDALGRLVAECERVRSFEARRDAAIVRLFAATGARLGELAGLELTDLDLRERRALVTGKGSRQRHIRFDHKTALAIDRYLRERARHPAADLPALWLGWKRRTAMTPSGIYRMIRRRAQALGIEVHPHMFRHTFSHNWLDAGGAEGDLMELNGWDSPQMLRHYGRSARAARAARAYDRVMGSGV